MEGGKKKSSLQQLLPACSCDQCITRLCHGYNLIDTSLAENVTWFSVAKIKKYADMKKELHYSTLLICIPTQLYSVAA